MDPKKDEIPPDFTRLVLKGHTDFLWDCTVDPKGRWIVSASDDKTLRVWDVEAMLGEEPGEPSSHYTNAKVLLVGNTSVGKSGLGLVLAGKKFRPTLSTHGRHVWSFEPEEVVLDSGVRSTRETILWDLAG